MSLRLFVNLFLNFTQIYLITFEDAINNRYIKKIKINKLIEIRITVGFADRKIIKGKKVLKGRKSFSVNEICCIFYLY